VKTIAPHHKVFLEFTPYSGSAEKGFEIDFLGCKIRHEFWPTFLRTGIPQISYPPVDEEYFEWIDVLESVVSAEKTYTMVELGAGFGRWLVRAARALRQRGGLPFQLIAVEAEPSHFEWIPLHFRDNDIDPAGHILIHAAVTDHAGDAFFNVGRRKQEKNEATEWYGQSLTNPSEAAKGKSHGVYKGIPALKHKSGKSIRVPAITLSQVLRDVEKVDLMDVDVQGEELKVISSAIEETTQKVKRLHIGTHSKQIEVGLRDVLRKHHWECLADYAGGSTNQTPWGPVSFGDGVQSWLNPRFA
jgi:FkbM family methyltransferase